MKIEIITGADNNPVAEFFSSSSTPETDTFAAHMSEEFIDPTWFKFSQELERERDEARELAQRLRVQLNHYAQANEMAEQAFRERDEAHKIAERAIDDLAWFSATNAKRLRNELEQLKDATE